MTNDETISWTITTFKITKELHNNVTKYNKDHPNDKINVSGICRGALEKELEWRLTKNNANKGE